MDVAQANLLQAQLIVEELRRQGIDHFVVCPGSRSTPLALALSLESRVAKIVHQDERGAGYFAAGYARATGRPAVVVTTSGTATANLYPSVIESSNDRIPLIVVTADRPTELRNCGANQTIDQVNLYGRYPRFFAELPCPDDCENRADILATVDTALVQALGSDDGPGPVHLNCPFRKPLAPSPEETGSLNMLDLLVDPNLSAWAESDQPLSALVAVPDEMPGESARALAAAVRKTDNGLLIIGRLDSLNERQEALHLSKALGWPSLIDITSGLAMTSGPNLIRAHDLVLSSEKFRKGHPTDMVIHVGGRFVSKRLLQYLRETKPTVYLQNDQNGQKVDPAHVLTQMSTYDNVSFCSSLAYQLEQEAGESSSLASWRGAGETTAKTIADRLEACDALSEPFIARTLSAWQSAATALFVASSMPVRDLDTFAASSSGLVPVGANRGTSGIDGTIASACGFAVGLGQPTTLLTGDQALLHDLNSLSLATSLPIPLTIVVINNNGGRIFEMLPIAAHTEALESFFVAPHDLTFEKIAGGFGLPYLKADSRESFAAAYKRAIESRATTVVEAIVDPEVSGKHRVDIGEAVRRALEAR